MEYVILGLLGLAVGSFINALVWRMHQKDQSSKTKAQTKNKKSSLQTPELSVWKGRSMCTDCKHSLAWYDLIPVFSWLQLKGKCRYCKKPISPAYPLVELIVAALFVGSFAVWPYALSNVGQWVLFSVWLVVISIGTALAKYDLVWMILPNKLAYAFNGASLLFLISLSAQTRDTGILISGLIGSLAFSGFFYGLYQISKGKWIGGGDVRLAVGLGLVLGWQKSILALMLAAYLGTFVIIALVLVKKYRKQMKMPFGPFLLAAGYFSLLCGQLLIDWYVRISQL